MTPVRYRIVGTIGRGGMGEVCLADDLMLHRQVALKFLTSPGESDALDQLLGEARAAAALDHPFICSIYEVTALDRRPCIAMEYVRGETLERRLRRGALPLPEALRAAEEIAEALDAAHRRRVIHRDLKPANVMLTEEQHVKVMDFGLATRLPTAEHLAIAPRTGLATDAGVVRGTPAYMAPEQIRGGTVDRRSDIFAFGIVLYQMLSGTNPFRRSAVDATLAAILGEPAMDLHRRAPDVPAALGAVVSRMLAKDPAERHQSFADVRHDLRRVAANQAAGFPVAAVMVDRSRSDGSARLIGRAAERAQILQIIGQTSAGRGGLVVITGDAGLGKSKLAEEALDAARQHGCQTLVGRCYEQDGTPPLMPYIEALEAASRLLPASAFRQAIGAGAPELARLLPELHRLFPDLAPPLELPPSLRQRYLFTNIRDVLARAARFAPLVVVLDDLQWADEATLQLTQHLAPHLANLPVTLIAAYREGEVPATPVRGTIQQLFARVRGQARERSRPLEIKAALNQLAAQGLARMIALRPLTEPEARDLLASLAHQDPPASLIRSFLDQTGGNPFFLTELFRHLREEGRLFDARGAWMRHIDFDDLEVPDTLRAVVERRIHHLSRDAQNVLRTAAIIGGHFELELLEAVADAPSETLMSALDEAERAQLLKGPAGRQDVTWRFTHQLIGQTLMRSMPNLRRQRLHLRVATAMERLAALPGPSASSIAHHLYSAGSHAEPVRTARALMAAGNAAHAVYATEEAVRHYGRALEVASDARIDEEACLGIEERLADLLGLIGDRATAMQHYRAVAEGRAVRHDTVGRARATRKIGTLHWQAGDRDQAMACFEQARQALDGSPTHVEAAHLYQELGLAAFRSGDNRQAVEWAERALRCAEAVLSAETPASAETRRDATTAIAHATNTIGVAMARSGDLEAARERIERSVSAACELGLLDVACRAYANLGVVYSSVEPKRAIEVSLTGLELASKIGAASLQSYIYANLAAAYCALTDRCDTEGLEAAKTAAALDRQLGQLDHLAVPLIVIAQIHQCRGELQEAHAHYAEALALAERAGEPQLVLPCYDGLATVCLDRGDRAAATEYMEKARDLCHRTGLDADTLLLLPFLA